MEYGWRKAASRSRVAMGRSFRKRRLASTRKPLPRGSGSDTTGAEASRLSEKPSATACAIGVPARAVKAELRASSWSVLPMRLK